MNDVDVVIENGKIAFEDQIVEGIIACAKGKIVSLGITKTFSSFDIKIDAKGMLIMPGAIDEHVHSREPGLEYKDNFENATKGAIAGGVTTILEMPNTIPPVDSANSVRYKLEKIMSKAYADFGLYGVLHNSNVDKFEEMVREGVIGFKIFLGPTTGNIPPPNDGQLYEILSKSSKFNIPITFHAENASIIAYMSEKLKSLGRIDPLAHTESRPPICEEEAVQKVALIAKYTGGIAHILHISAASVFEIITQARKKGVHIFGETCPQYLFLSTDDYAKYGNLIKINPPLRDKDNQKALWQKILNGDVYSIGSDHAPHAPEEKSSDVWNSAAGFLGVQTVYRLLIDAALKNQINIHTVIRLLAKNPAMLFKLYPTKGCIALGSDADLVILNPKDETVIDEKILYSKYPLTPFLNWKLKGKIEKTILRGKIVFENGEVKGPSGKFLKKV
ncbi:hypothetical protein B9Q02_03735 [Candidatus Marsarchaeota G1 archaeon BE_D]|jgi:dihydroorotase|uniref:Amidohydrolase-related domain-containing protein n=1 Tax=Candidatus Marsarchaeota G1 archaeon BE_D TaxID=1978156 RepID=A0A2R6AI88_9ARCH|nr:MAG: hypothetical protein B9Q02_03735 [Candidatus Marsarchaeota G1 archaeon BE_D]